MDKKTVNDILWSLNYVSNYVKTYGENDAVFNTSHVLMHLKNVTKALKVKSISKNRGKL